MRKYMNMNERLFKKNICIQTCSNSLWESCWFMNLCTKFGLTSSASIGRSTIRTIFSAPAQKLKFGKCSSCSPCTKSSTWSQVTVTVLVWVVHLSLPVYQNKCIICFKYFSASSSWSCLGMYLAKKTYDNRTNDNIRKRKNMFGQRHKPLAEARHHNHLHNVHDNEDPKIAWS